VLECREGLEEAGDEGRDGMDALLPPGDGITADAQRLGQSLLRPAQARAEGFQLGGGHGASFGHCCEHSPNTRADPPEPIQRKAVTDSGQCAGRFNRQRGAGVMISMRKAFFCGS